MKIECTECSNKSKLIRCDGNHLFCICLEPQCGHSFALSINFKHTIKSPSVGATTIIPYIENNLLFCGCGHRSKILKTNRLSLSVADIYCECTHCNHRFVFIRAYEYSLSPSAKQTSALANTLLRALTPAARDSLRQQLELFQ